MSWGWRTKPRSIIKTLQWFKSFANLENENWNYTNGKLSRNGYKIHPIRREYYFNAQKNEDISSPIYGITYFDYLNGTLDASADSESNARNDLATYKFFGFGYVDTSGNIKITKAGKLIEIDRFDGEMLLKQLLKINFPSLCTGFGRKIEKGKRVYPLNLIIKLLINLEYINRYELAYLFLCDDNSDYNLLQDSITQFREKYNQLVNKNDRIKCEVIFRNIAESNFNFPKDGDIKTLFTMGDAISRSLEFTNLFDVSGRGNYSKIRIAEHSRKKVELLNEKYNYHTIETSSLDEYMDWFGNTDNIILPWENEDERKNLIIDKIDLLNKTIHIVNEKYSLELKLNENELYSKVQSINTSSELKLFEEDLIKQLTSLNENIFVKYLSQGFESRKEIIEKFNDIVSGNEDMAALWLECNTWKSLVAINGEKVVKRNFDIEEDLTPKSFAPGKNNTPDIELYTSDDVLIPEVSLMSGVQQWEHEGSSVIDHVLKFIDKEKNKNVYGLFISKAINVRTNWQFFILNKESWMGKPVPVIPFTIEQYKDITSFIYDKNLNINNFIELIKQIHIKAKESANYQEWNNNCFKVIKEWKKLYV